MDERAIFAWNRYPTREESFQARRGQASQAGRWLVLALDPLLQCEPAQQHEKEENMFVAISEYLKPLEEVGQFSAAHAAWTMRHYASGRFLGSGRRVPPVGGIILARGESREEFLSILAEDPFQQNGLAKYEVFEFNEGPLPRRSAELEAFLSRPLRGEAGE